MNGTAYEADYIVAWPTAEIAVMGPDGAVNIIHRKTIEAVPEEERTQKRLELAEEIRQNIDPYIAAGHAQLDDVIDPADTRHAIWRGLQVVPRASGRPALAQARRPARLTTLESRRHGRDPSGDHGERVAGRAEEGQMVAEGDEIVILESMKMEIPVVTEIPGVVRELHVEPEQVVQEGDLIALIDES